MSEDRKNAKLAALSLCGTGIVVPIMFLIVTLRGVQNYPTAFLVCAIGLSILAIAVGWLGIKGANVPAQIQPYVYGCIAVIVVAAVSLFLSPRDIMDEYVGIVFALLAGYGFIYARRVHERALK